VNFQPYHSFSGCVQLEREVEGLADNAVTPEVLERFHTHHFSLIHKLRAALKHLEDLEEYLSRQDTLEEEPVEIVFMVNLHFDGFTHSLGSALDILAREVLGYFDLIPNTNVYYWTARSELNQHRPGDVLIPRLQDPAWLQEFKDYRNTGTHESIIGTRFDQAFEMRGNVHTTRLKFPLPDDPKIPQSERTYLSNPDIVEYCNSIFKKSLRLINPVYVDIRARIRTAQSLPL
jgi:hypothetical protein